MLTTNFILSFVILLKNIISLIKMVSHAKHLSYILVSIHMIILTFSIKTERFICKNMFKYAKKDIIKIMMDDLVKEKNFVRFQFRTK